MYEKGLVMDEQKIFGELYNINIEEYENIDIDSVLFSVRVNNRLHRAGLETVGALLKCTPQRLAEINGFGAGCFKEIYEYLDSLTTQKENDKSIQKCKRRLLPDSFRENKENIIKGDFSFVTDESDVLVQEYKEAQSILENELIEQCINNPEYVSIISKSLSVFSESVVKVSQMLSNIPADRYTKKVKYYIDACSSTATAKGELYAKLFSEDVGLERFIYNNKEELCDDNSVVFRFVKSCCYDIGAMTELFFDEVRKNERAFDIVKLRADGDTLEQVGNTYAVTRERVRQIEKKTSHRFINWLKHNSIMYKIVADENGSCVLFPSVFDVYFKEHASIVLFFLKAYGDELEYVNYYKNLDLFIVGDDSVLIKAQEYADDLPDQFNEDKLVEYLHTAYEKYDVPEKLMLRCIEDEFKKTGDVYHRSRLTLGKIYSDVLANHYPNGIWIYNDEQIKEFRNYVFKDYGEIKLPDNNRAFVGRISAVGILCGRGMYGPKKEKYISEELKKKIHDYINESETPIFLTNTLFSVFEEELLSEGVTNKYYLQGILRELFEDEYIFRRDYISKDRNITSVYSEIVSFIEQAEYSVTKRQICEAFPGVTEIVINISVSDSEIINLFGAYIHANKLKLHKDDLEYISCMMKNKFTRVDYLHCKDLYDYVLRDNPNILTSNGIYQAFGFYSILEYLYREEYEFSRPYIARKGVEITRTFDQLHEMVQASDVIQLSDIIAVARDNHFQINSILEFANSCNETHLLANDKELVALEYAGITDDIANTVVQTISEEVMGTVFVMDLHNVHKFPKINLSWSEWLIYSVVNKWGDTIEAGVTSTTFKQAKALVAPSGKLSVEGFENWGGSGEIYMPDNLENIDELIADILFNENEE